MKPFRPGNPVSALRDEVQADRSRRSGCGFSCCLFPFVLLAVLVLLTGLNALLILAAGSDVPGRVISVAPERKRTRYGTDVSFNLRYSYEVNGKTHTGEARVSEADAKKLFPGRALTVRTFKLTAGFGAYAVGFGPPFYLTALGIGLVCLPLLLIAGFVVLPLFDRMAALVRHWRA